MPCSACPKLARRGEWWAKTFGVETRPYFPFRSVTIKCEENECRRVLLQSWDQPRPNIGIKRFSFTHRVSRIGVNHCKHRLLVLRQSQICLDNLNRRRCIAHRASACCLPVFLGHARQPAISRSAFTVRQLLVVATVVIPGEVGDQ